MLHLRSGCPGHTKFVSFIMFQACYLSFLFFSEAHLRAFPHCQPALDLNEHGYSLSQADCPFVREHAVLSSPALSILNCNYQKDLMHSASRNGNQCIHSARLRGSNYRGGSSVFSTEPSCTEGTRPPKTPGELHY